MIRHNSIPFVLWYITYARTKTCNFILFFCILNVQSWQKSWKTTVENLTRQVNWNIYGFFTVSTCVLQPKCRAMIAVSVLGWSSYFATTTDHQQVDFATAESAKGIFPVPKWQLSNFPQNLQIAAPPRFTSHPHTSFLRPRNLGWWGRLTTVPNSFLPLLAASGAKNCP